MKNFKILSLLILYFPCCNNLISIFFTKDYLITVANDIDLDRADNIKVLEPKLAEEIISE